MSVSNVFSGLAMNPFEHPGAWRQKIIENVKLTHRIKFNGKGFICALINSRCPVGCDHCMFFSNMSEGKNSYNTMTEPRLTNLMKLVRDSNTCYLLVSGGGECFLEPDLMYRIVEETKADITWLVTGAHWARDKEKARDVIRNIFKAFKRGKLKEYDRKICIRVSLDEHHVKRIARSKQNPLQYVVNIVQIFEDEYADEDNFVLMIHSLIGHETLVNDLCKEISGKKLSRHDPLHDNLKITESAFTVKLETGYEFEVTFAKQLLSDLAADLRDKEYLKKRIELFDKDAFRNERGKPSIKYNVDGKIGPNMLVVYNGRVAGGWQSEMPDVSINLDFDDFNNIMKKTLSDPGVLGTIENGLSYRFEIVNEVCTKAVLRSKAVNIRDYSSLILLEEDKIKLYYSVRVLQDFIVQSRIQNNELESWPKEIQKLVRMSKHDLQTLYNKANYDIIQQYIETESAYHFDGFVRCIKKYDIERDPQIILGFFKSHPNIGNRTIDKWRLLLERIVNDWYDLYSFNQRELDAIEEIEKILDEKILAGKRIYEGLSLQ